MNIDTNSVVSIEFTLKNGAGEVLDSSVGDEPLVYLHGHKNIIPGLEKELQGKSEGDKLEVTIEPSDAYGERRPELLADVPKSEFSAIPNLEVGMDIQADTDQGTQMFTVVNIDGETVTVDGNHPLAGETLFFDVTVLSIREASSEEIDHGHVHGPGGHHH